MYRIYYWVNLFLSVPLHSLRHSFYTMYSVRPNRQYRALAGLALKHSSPAASNVTFNVLVILLLWLTQAF